MKNQKTSSKKKINHYVVLLFLIIGSIFFFGLYSLTKTKNKSYSIDSDSVAKTTSSAPSAQEDFTSSEERPVLDTGTDKGSATITDRNGGTDNGADSSVWTTSKDKEITVYSPTKNELLKNDSTLSGESTLGIVYFRIIDNISGLISDGQLSVINGKFSGNINLETKATEGRLDIYGIKEGGVEFGNIEIPVRFK